jgi:hypothetical protein
MTITDDTINPDETVLTEPSTYGRRWLLRSGGIGLVAVAVAACSDDDDDDDEGASTEDTTDTTSDDMGGDDSSGDLAIAKVAASLEVLAVTAYDMTLQAATANKIGPVPPAVAEFVTVAKAQHQEHLDGWNAVITGAGEEAVADPPADLAEDIINQFNEVTNVTQAAELALLLEETAAATYLDALRTLSSEARKTAGAIICIDRQHAAILNFVLGQYPVPDTFATTEIAYKAQ